jgi:hypothetical protein
MAREADRMALFKPLSDLGGSIGSTIQGITGLLNKAQGEGLGQGLKGVLQDALDLNIDGLMDTIDSGMGTGIMHLTIDGDKEGVETALRFRNYAVMRLVELRDMRDIINKFTSHDSDESTGAVGEMSEFLEGKQEGVVCSEREESLREQTFKMRKMVKQMSEFLDSEEKAVDGGFAMSEADREQAEAKSRPRAPSRVTARGTARIVVGNEDTGNGK